MDESMGRIWWRELFDSASYCHDIVETLLSGASALLYFHLEAPWQTDFIDAISDKLLEATEEDYTLDVYDVHDESDAGEYLFRHFCRREQQDAYWPATHHSYEEYLASLTGTTLEGRTICLTGLDKKNTPAWIESIRTYLKNCPKERRAHFLLIAHVGACESPLMPVLDYDNYVTDYACTMLCMMVTTSFPCRKAEKMYLCEVASGVSQNRAELAGLLAEKHIALIQNPDKVTLDVCRENGFTPPSYEEINRAVWEAQIKSVFPKIENFRVDFITQHYDALKRRLPIDDAFGENINDPIYLEIGQLIYLCGSKHLGGEVSDCDYAMLMRMRDARNDLAHLGALSYHKLQALDIF